VPTDTAVWVNSTATAIFSAPTVKSIWSEPNVTAFCLGWAEKKPRETRDLPSAMTSYLLELDIHWGVGMGFDSWEGICNVTMQTFLEAVTKSPRQQHRRCYKLQLLLVCLSLCVFVPCAKWKLGCALSRNMEQLSTCRSLILMHLPAFCEGFNF
jgi:hypothetical protein